MKDIDQLVVENEKLKLAVSELSILNEIATSISTTQSVDEIVDQIVVRCIKHLRVEEGTIHLLEEIDEQDKFQTMIRRQDLTTERMPIKLNDQITGWMLKKQTPLICNDFSGDQRFTIPDHIPDSIRNLLSVPLIIKGKLIGFLAVLNKKNEDEFTEKDRRLMMIIASQAAQIIESARLYEEEKNYLLLKEELNVARRIQERLLPDTYPQIEGYQIAGINRPSKEVGGDYYDFIEVSETKIGFCVADITGKGMPASLLMSNLQALLRSQVLTDSNIASAIANVNTLLHKSTEPGKFATMFYGVLDTNDHTLTYCNAGHDEPMLIRDEALHERLPATGLLLGVMPEMEYEVKQLTMQPGDFLCVYTDGITEAMNDERVEFGEERTIQSILANCDGSASYLQNALLMDVSDHAAAHPQSDDITVVVVKRL